MSDEAPRIRPAFVTLEGEFFAYQEGEEQLHAIAAATFSEQTRPFDAANFTTLIGTGLVFGPFVRYLESWVIVGNRALYTLVLEGLSVDPGGTGLLHVALPFTLRDGTQATCIIQDSGVGGGGYQPGAFVGVNPDAGDSNLIIVSSPATFGEGTQTLSIYVTLTLVIVP